MQHRRLTTAGDRFAPRRSPGTPTDDIGRRPVRALASLTTLGLVVALALQVGCYRRVVGVKGPTSPGYEVYEPNLREDQPGSPGMTPTRPTRTPEKR